MKCRQVEKKLNAFLDQEVNDSERNAILIHLQSCHRCQNELSSLKKLNEDLRIEIREDLDINITEDLILKSRFIKTKSRKINEAVVSVASMFLAVVLGTYISNVTFNKSVTSDSTVSNSVESYYDQQTLYAALEEVTQ
jgi:anti-sigma factor RsiW